MKKKLSYRDKLVELAYIYDVREIKEYEKSRKNLTTGQLELILKKNKIIIPKDYKSNFFRDTFVKPISKLNEKGLGILISDHNVKAMIDICENVKVINSGRIIADGSPAEITDNSIVKKVYLGESF